jgi:hypothetical protein
VSGTLSLTPDLGTFLLLGGILLLEGIRRVPPGALVLRRVGVAGFRTVAVPSGIRLVSLFPPLTTSVVVTPADPAGGPTDDAARARQLTARLAATRLMLGSLQVLGGVITAGLLAGIPIAMVRGGLVGTLLVIVVLLLLSVLAMVLLSIGLEAVGLSRRAAWGKAIGLISPFAAPRAAEILLEAAVAGAPPRRVAQLLLPPDEFVRWIRPQLFDARAQGAPLPELADLVPEPEWAERLAARPAGAEAGPYCPRCGADYRAGVRRCADCDVELAG